MVPRNTRTIIVKSGFPAGTSHAGVAGIIANSLAGLVALFVFPSLTHLIKRPMRRPGSFLLGTSVVTLWSRLLSLLSWFICFLLRGTMAGLGKL